MNSLALLLLVLQTAQAAPPPAQAAPPPGRFSGLVFGDYYYFPSNHLPAWEDQHGLWIRRAYFTYDHTFTPTVTTRFRLELNSNGKLQGGAITPFLKDAYVRWTFTGRQTLTAGIQPTLTFEHIDNVWGLRHIEKPAVDLYRVDSSRDTGLTVAGPLNEKQTVRYAVQYGNDAGSNSETDKYKSYRAAVRYDTNPGFTVEAFFGHFDRDRDADRRMAQLFAAYRGKRARVGAQYSQQTRRAADGSTAPDITLDLYSGFAVVDLKPQKVSGFLRVDRVNDPCADCAASDYLPIDPGAAFTTTIAGIEYFLLPSVRFSPNFEWVRYSEPAGTAARPKNDLAARMTFYWVW